MKSTLVEKRNKLMTEAQAIITAKHIDSEKRAMFDTMMKDVDRLDAEIQLEERSVSRPPRSQPGENGGSTHEERSKSAFREWMRTGTISQENRSYIKETRDIGATVGTGVGATTITSSVAVPVGFNPQLNIAQKSYGQLVGAVRSFKTATGEPVKTMLSDDTQAGLTVIAEGTAVTELDPNLSGSVSYVDELTTSLIKVGNSLLNDAAFDVDAFIENTFAVRYFRGLAQMIQLGNGSHIQSIAAGVALGATSGAPTAISLTDLINTFSALDVAYLDNAKWVMGPGTRSGLMGLTDNYGRPLLQADVSGTPFNAIYGKPIVISTYADTVLAGKTPVLFGDLEASYTLRTVGDLQIVRLTERYAELNQTGFIGRCRAGGFLTTQAVSPSLVSLKCTRK